MAVIARIPTSVSRVRIIILECPCYLHQGHVQKFLSQLPRGF